MAKKALVATMKGFKNFPKTDTQVVVEFEKDMQAGKDAAALKEQAAEFTTYLQAKISKGGKVSFFESMFKKITDGVLLTENMINAVRKCMNEDSNKAAPAPDAPIDYTKLPSMTLKMKQWWMKANKLESRVITGYIVKETAKAYLIHGHADMIEGCWCMRCGRPLTLPASYTIGFGADCASKVGVPYPGDLNTMSAKKKAAYKKTILKTLHNQKIEAWVPKSQVEEILKTEQPGK